MMGTQPYAITLPGEPGKATVYLRMSMVDKSTYYWVASQWLASRWPDPEHAWRDWIEDASLQLGDAPVVVIKLD